jgi:hypothetical protein
MVDVVEVVGYDGLVEETDESVAARLKVLVVVVVVPDIVTAKVT